MVHKIIIVLFLLSSSSLVHAQKWYAMARHGECSSLSKVTERKKLLKGLSTPSDIENRLEKIGIEYKMEPFVEDQKGMLMLNVPSEGIAMILVKEIFCNEFPNK